MRASTRFTPRRRRKVAVVAGLSAAVLVAGTASAYWKTTGTGSGSAKVGVGQTILSVSATVTTGLLYPSTTYKGDLFLTLSSPVNAKVTGIARDPSRAITVSGGVGGSPACTATVPVTNAPTIVLTATTGLNINLTANTPFTTSLAAKVAMDFDAPSSCQNATFTIPVILTGTAT